MNIFNFIWYVYLLILCEDFWLIEQLHKKSTTCCLTVRRHAELSLYLTCFYSLIVMDILSLCVVSTGSGVSTQSTMSTQHHEYPPSPLIHTQPPTSSEGETNPKHSVDSWGFLFPSAVWMWFKRCYVGNRRYPLSGTSMRTLLRNFWHSCCGLLMTILKPDVAA